MTKFVVLKNTCDKNLFITHLPSNYCVGVYRNGKLTLEDAQYLSPLNTNRIQKKATISKQNEFNKKRTQRALKREQNEILVVGNQDAINTSIGHVEPIQQTIAIQGLLNFNLEATEVSQVYPHESYFESSSLVHIKKIWKQREWNKVLEELEEYHCGPTMRELIKQCMIQKSNKQRLQELLFIQLHILHLLHPKKNKSFTDYFKSTFKEKGVFTGKMKDKLVLFILVQLLTISGFILDLSLWSKDLKIPVTELQKAAKELGCRTEARGKIKLVLPLAFPRITR